MLQNAMAYETIEEMIRELDEEWVSCHRHGDAEGRYMVTAKQMILEELRNRLYEKENNRNKESL